MLNHQAHYQVNVLFFDIMKIPTSHLNLVSFEMQKEGVQGSPPKAVGWSMKRKGS